MNTATELYKILTVHGRSEGIRINNSFLLVVFIGYDEFVLKLVNIRNNSRIKTGFIGKLHLISLLGILNKNTYSLRIWIKSLHKIVSSNLMCSEYSVRIVSVRINNLFNLRPVHHLVQSVIHYDPLQIKNNT